MSRIGNQPIPVPKGVKLDINGTYVKVVGPKGTLERTIRPEIGLQAEGDNLIVVRKDNSKRTRAFSGLTRTLINNMIVGVDKGFQKKLAIEGVGYRAEVKGSVLNLSVGYSNPFEFDLPKGVSAEVDKANNVTLDCIDKELLGETAAKIRAVRPPEPYKGKGIRYADEYIARKAGKSASKK
ncbi:MAG: 50S ribosomal protein L6 [Desulfurivibrionaceae bacterium]|jgi:large subunit ribosomal protein L6|nr:50S ribosomal protein L6 [Pseudomonadota bacterium]MCG2822749.1 50S ribosomal protein L6 [Desulfobulbaceae bacterium]MDP2002200.1 50S ribosomal protein L6 [Desulfurivibrionaceae bacterium]PKN16436.1 MAG: 50S ribosomal protein L6 [Deltaproteobacteria bacterium HGW-Deltaproteobacteria-3]MBU4407451.1 50S ribosomal protein L6 [Pseudomonadota bacterium]